MATKKIIQSAVAIPAAPVPVLAPELKVTTATMSTTPAVPVIPAKLPARKSATARKPTIKKLAVPTPVQAEKAAVPEKIKKPKLVRDSFTIPKAEYVVIDALKERAALLTRPVKKSELLRAGIKLLAALPDDLFLVALEQVPALKTGRPVLEKQSAASYPYQPT